MSGISTLLAAADRRRRRYARLGRVLPQLLVALPGVLLIAVPGSRLKVCHDLGLTLLVAALSLPVWRAPEAGLPDPLRFRERHRRVFWRIGAVLLAAATLCLAVDRRFDGRHALGSAHAAADTGAALTCAALLVLLLERQVWRLWPGQLRRAAATAEVLRRISRRSLAAGGPMVTGLPEPELRQPAGEPSPTPCTTYGRKRRHRVDRSRPGMTVLRWDGRNLTLNNTGVPVPLPMGRPGEAPQADWAQVSPVAEVVWVGHRALPEYGQTKATLLLLDAEGRRSVHMSHVRFDRLSAAEVSAAAGIPFTAYDLTFAASWYDELVDALFPKARKSLDLYG
ncbi:hypothetical protein GXW83_06595 [Streptacidiphilus sp. PB12-B1b]|uniref:hypothetical protein n=1 Tax=Streptacidiphilus sp. PB12-B1b TaxID=2705012 RepID=UPI0015FD2B02|nr:hypothetical protein [Streptacidiphilus sp. PB12-B1b]QMU75463.1 hypothetical protein GXW83_06595 [Streptacidiphilus sp. PB12-B1b]